MMRFSPDHMMRGAESVSMADADYTLTGATWTAYVKKAPRGWERYEALVADGNDVEFSTRAASR